MSAPLTIILAAWALGAAVLLAVGVGSRPGVLMAWLSLGLAPALIAAEQGAWHLGEWSRDLSPLPVFGAVFLVTVALELRLPRAEPARTAAGTPPRPRRPISIWTHGALVVSAAALGLLGDSGLSLAVAAAMALVAGGAALRRPRPPSELHPTNQAKGHIP